METSDVRKALTQIDALPTLPSVLGKILSTAADPDASAMDLGKHIAADQSLSATILKLVNSAYYGFYRQITSVTQAIVMLGFLEVRNLTLTATAFKSLNKSNSDYNRLQLWHHALATAIAADRLAKLLGTQAEGAFEAGLLHDIGKVVLDIVFPEEFNEAARLAHEQECSLTVTELEIFGLDHGEAGSLFADQWNLPTSVAESIHFHHTPEKAETAPQLCQIINLANYLTYEANFGESANGCAPESPDAVIEALGCTDAIRSQVISEITESQERIDGFLGAMS